MHIYIYITMYICLFDLHVGVSVDDGETIAVVYAEEEGDRD